MNRDQCNVYFTSTGAAAGHASHRYCQITLKYLKRQSSGIYLPTYGCTRKIFIYSFFLSYLSISVFCKFLIEKLKSLEMTSSEKNFRCKSCGRKILGKNCAGLLVNLLVGLLVGLIVDLLEGLHVDLLVGLLVKLAISRTLLFCLIIFRARFNI